MLIHSTKLCQGQSTDKVFNKAYSLQQQLISVISKDPQETLLKWPDPTTILSFPKKWSSKRNRTRWKSFSKTERTSWRSPSSSCRLPTLKTWNYTTRSMGSVRGESRPSMTASRTTTTIMRRRSSDFSLVMLTSYMRNRCRHGSPMPKWIQQELGIWRISRRTMANSPHSLRVYMRN